MTSPAATDRRPTLRRAIHGVAVIALAAGLAACGESPNSTTGAGAATPTTSPGTAAATPVPTPKEGRTTEPAAAPAGAYIDQADYEADPAAYAGADVVLFFNASWCPTCQEATGNLSGAAYPAGLVVVSVDYDAATDLRQRYGVTTQHTFVQIDADGAEVAKWTGSVDVAGITENLQG